MQNISKFSLMIMLDKFPLDNFLGPRAGTQNPNKCCVRILWCQHQQNSVG